MRSVVQRVAKAQVTVAGEITGQIGPGLLVLLGVGHNDKAADARWMVDKLVGLRVFEDGEGKMNRSLEEIGGGMLVVSQFTLLGDCRKGRRPSFVAAAPPEQAERLYEAVIQELQGRGVEIATGLFRADMQVSLVNDGPVTLVIDSPTTH